MIRKLYLLDIIQAPGTELQRSVPICEEAVGDSPVVNSERQDEFIR